MKEITKKKKLYKTTIWLAKKRIQNLESSTHLSEEVKKEHIEHLSKKIEHWEKDGEGLNLVTALGNHVCLFTGYNVKNTSHSRLKEMKIARGIFYKYGIDWGISASILREYTGSRSTNVPGEYRAFINSSEDNLEIYKKFKEYFEKSIENEGD